MNENNLQGFKKKSFSNWINHKFFCVFFREKVKILNFIVSCFVFSQT